MENLINLGLKGADFICKKIEAYYELVNASDDLQTNINDLRQIVSKINTRRKTKRDAVNLVKKYSSSIATWNKTINKLVMDEKLIPEMGPLLKLAGYSGLWPYQTD